MGGWIGSQAEESSRLIAGSPSSVGSTRTETTSKNPTTNNPTTNNPTPTLPIREGDSSVVVTDSTGIRRDSTGTGIDSTNVGKERKQSALTGPVHYQSSDSMVMMANGTAYLHGKGELKYESMELDADYIRMNIDSSLIYAHGVYDSLEYEWKGKPVFKDGKDSYETNEITYNIKTQKGFIRHVVTQQGEG